ncbi:D-alanyl-D-alanine carboxypeptidase family protein [Leucothrix sargassi]|nr:D-alanyl-D-alanine carboxypeptidase family protein [Leucothrix sargassi]
MQLTLNKLSLLPASLVLLSATASANPPTLLAVSQQNSYDSSISDSFLMGKYSASKRSDFVKISTRHASRAGMYLQRLPYDAFKAMYNDAKNSGVTLKIISATRSFYHQKSIWEAKWTGKRRVGDIRNITRTIKNHEQRAVKILEYSSMPGSSRHHWGTDIDLNSFTNSYFASGQGKKTYDWLVQNAPRYGFCQPYTAKGKDRTSGYNEEKWHWSFQPLAGHYTQQAKLRLSDSNFTGFAGASTATRIGIINKYVLGINPRCF